MSLLKRITPSRTLINIVSALPGVGNTAGAALEGTRSVLSAVTPSPALPFVPPPAPAPAAADFSAIVWGAPAPSSFSGPSGAPLGTPAWVWILAVGAVVGLVLLFLRGQ